jgi:chromosome segregation ATPase
MIYRRLILVMTMLVLASPSGWSQVADVPEKAPDNSQPKSTAYAMFHFTVSRGEDMALVASLVKSKSLQSEAVQMIMKKSKEEQAELPEIHVESTRKGDTEYQVWLTSFDDLLPAEKVLEAFKEVLTAKLLTLDTTRTSLENQVTQERERVLELAAKLSAERDDLTKLAVTNRIELDPAVAVQKRIRLETELQSLNVEVQGVEARKDAIEHQIADLAKKASAGASPTDPILLELTKSIEARRKVVESRQAQFVAQGSSLENVEQAKDELAKAEVELARYRRTLADASGGQRMAELQRRLEDTAIDLVETTTKLRAVERLSDQARQHSAEVEAKRIEVELLEQDYRRAREELSQLESKLRQHVSPSVTLIPLN